MFIGIFLALAGAFSHSISFISRKRGLEVADYKLFVLIRIVIAIFFSGILLWALGPGLSGLTPKIALLFVLTGGLAGGFVALFTVILTHFFLRGIERVNWKIGLSTCSIVAGAILVSIN